MLESERLERLSVLAGGDPAPAHDLPLQFWRGSRPEPSLDAPVIPIIGGLLRAAGALTGGNTPFIVARFRGTDGRELFAEFDDIPDVIATRKPRGITMGPTTPRR